MAINRPGDLLLAWCRWYPYPRGLYGCLPAALKRVVPHHSCPDEDQGSFLNERPAPARRVVRLERTSKALRQIEIDEILKRGRDCPTTSVFTRPSVFQLQACPPHTIITATTELYFANCKPFGGSEDRRSGNPGENVARCEPQELSTLPEGVKSFLHSCRRPFPASARQARFLILRS